MKIGLPRAFLYHRYRYLWTEFFNLLGHETVVSPPTNKKILADGISASVDESCLPGKIFLGHVAHLTDKCDYILIPRIASYGKNEKTCVKFNALYDVTSNTFEANFLHYNVDVLRGKSERRGFISLGKFLGHSIKESADVYDSALQAFLNSRRAEAIKEVKKFLSPALKILLIGHAYNLHDACVGAPAVRLLTNSGATVIYADKLSGGRVCDNLRMPGLYWTFHKELLSAVQTFKHKADGLMFLTAFPCGPDALVYELTRRNLCDIPACNLIMDEHSGESGLETRVESFLDIVKSRRLKVKGEKQT